MEYIHTISRNVHETDIFAKIKALDILGVNPKLHKIMNQVAYWGFLQVLCHPDLLHLGLLLNRQQVLQNLVENETGIEALSHQIASPDQHSSGL
jgi:hypothetical protein